MQTDYVFFLRGLIVVLYCSYGASHCRRHVLSSMVIIFAEILLEYGECIPFEKTFDDCRQVERKIYTSAGTPEIYGISDLLIISGIYRLFSAYPSA